MAQSYSCRIVKKVLGIHPLMVKICGCAFFCMLLPLYFNLTDNADSFINMPQFQLFKILVQVGILMGGIVFVIIGLLLKMPVGLRFSTVVIGSAGCIVSILLLGVAFFLNDSNPVIYAAGLIFGLCLDIVFLAWSLCVKSASIKSLLLNCSVCCIASVLVNILLSQLTIIIVGIVYIFICFFALLPILVKAAGGQLSFPLYEGTSGLNEDLGLLLRRTSLRDMLFVLFSSLTGLLLFVVLSNSQQQVIFQSGPTITSLSIAVSAFLVAVFSQISSKPVLPFIYQVLFPALAGFLIVLDSFVVGSTMFGVGAFGVFFYFSLIAVFTIAFLVAVNGKGEFSSFLVIGFSMSLLSVAALLGSYLPRSGLDGSSRGSILLVACTCYFVVILFSPIVQAWRDRQNDDVDTSIQKAEQKDYTRYCEMLAERNHFSQRESEVFYYVGRGYNASYIAKALYISNSTVRTHLQNIYRKMGVSSKTDILKIIEMLSDSDA